MTPSGPAHERETIIRFSDDDDSVEIWTASGKVFRKCQRLGFEMLQDNVRSGLFRCSVRNLTLRKAKSALTEDQKAKVAARFKKGPKQPV